MTASEGHRRLLALCAAKDFEEAVTLAKELVALYPNEPAFWHLLGAICSQLNQLALAKEAFGKAAQLKPLDAVAHYNLGCVLQRQKDARAATLCFENAITCDPQHVQSYNNLATSLYDTGAVSDAIVALENALEIAPSYVDAAYNLARMLHETRAFSRAIRLCEQVLKLSPDHADAFALLFQLKGKVCDFTVFDDFERIKTTYGITTGAVPPFGCLHLEDQPERQLLRTKRWLGDRFPNVQAAAPRINRNTKLKIGYFSGNFQDHPVMFLNAGLFRAHDPSGFEVMAFHVGPNALGELGQKMRQVVSAFHQVHAVPDEDIARLAQSCELDIAIDLDGHTQNARPGVYAHRAAPVQVTYLGYPGSSAAPFMDYLVADRTLVPPNLRQHYSERILFMPGTYQPTDNKRQIDQVPTTRGEMGLPEAGFVFCCFNNSNKIGPLEFDVWMRILSKVPGSVLWLLKSHTEMQDNLRREAKARGVSPDRLCFAQRLTQAEHLARHRHADLFLDTFNYNAHTTASDALWAGLPVVTLQGQQFAARVASSLLKAAGLPELVTQSTDAYEALILDLARHPKRLAALKAKLAQTRNTCALFDTVGYTRAFEDGLQRMHQRYRDGLPAVDIYLE